MPDDHIDPTPPFAAAVRRHRLAAAIAALGALLVAGHVIMGPSIVPVPVVAIGALLLLAGGVPLLRARTRAT